MVIFHLPTERSSILNTHYHLLKIQMNRYLVTTIFAYAISTDLEITLPINDCAHTLLVKN